MRGADWAIAGKKELLKDLEQQRREKRQSIHFTRESQFCARQQGESGKMERWRFIKLI